MLNSHELQIKTIFRHSKEFLALMAWRKQYIHVEWPNETEKEFVYVATLYQGKIIASMALFPWDPLKLSIVECGVDPEHMNEGILGAMLFSLDKVLAGGEWESFQFVCDPTQEKVLKQAGFSIKRYPEPKPSFAEKHISHPTVIIRQ